MGIFSHGASTMKVGDFVRFSSSIMYTNRHLALTGDKGLIVAMCPKGRIASVVWQDGHKGNHRVEVLARTVGVMGHAATSVGEKRNPLPDRGHKPQAAPPRTIPAPIPCLADWSVGIEEKKILFPVKGKNGKDETALMRLTYALVSGSHWPTGTEIRVLRTRHGYSVTHPDGAKTSYTPTGFTTWAKGRFGDMTHTRIMGIVG